MLTRLKDRGPSLIKEKHIIYLPKFTFIGLVLWQRTRHWSNGRESRSIETSTWTTESTEVKSFLGLVNSNTRFIPDLTTISEPSRRLTKKEESVCFWSRAAGSLHRTETTVSRGRVFGEFWLQCRNKDYCWFKPSRFKDSPVTGAERGESCYCLFQLGTAWCGTTSTLCTNGKGSIRNCLRLWEISRVSLWTSILTVDRSQTSRIRLFWVVQTFSKNRKMVLQLQPHFLLWNICLGKWTLQMLCHAVQLSKKLGREMLLRTEYTRFGKHSCAKSHDRWGNWGDVWSRWRVREPTTMPATMYQDRKLGECKLFRLQVSQRRILYFWKYVPERNKNSGTKEIWSKGNWVRSWLHQGMLRMKQRCGDQNLIRKPRSFAKHVMGDKLGVDQAVLNLATWLRCL